MRKSVSSIAIIESPEDACSAWLTQWNENWERLSLIGGHREDGESSRECLVREVREELLAALMKTPPTQEEIDLLEERLRASTRVNVFSSEIGPGNPRR